MEFDFRDAGKMVSHFMLQDVDIAKQISVTPEWKNEGKHIAKMTVNGVEIPFEVAEKYFEQLYYRTLVSAQSRFADMEKEAHRMAEEILKEQAEKIREKLFDFEQKLDDIGSILTPWYEKK